MDDWPFDDPKNVATLTVRQVVHLGHPILLVSHDAEDGMWQFLTGDAVDMADALIVSLQSVYLLDPSIAGLADLPLGWKASRPSRAEPWQRRSCLAGESQ
ncbi:MAG TPA: hypothetical protein VKE40_22440 [Gemmataceae bacterium]|nr:hypothetical protein [Gemmataceae bacterium]